MIRRLALIGLLIQMLLVGLSVYLFALAGGDPEEQIFNLVFLVTGVLGALIASRRPENSIGWLLLGASLMSQASTVFDKYAVYGLVTRPGAVPASEWAAWASNWPWVFGLVGVLVFLPLLFPDGRLPTPGWTIPAWVFGAYVTAVAVVFGLRPELELYLGNGDLLVVDNPIGIEALDGVARWLDGPGYLFFLGFGMAAVVSLVGRFRRAGFEQRSQIKWLAWAVGIMMLVLVTQTLVQLAGVENPGNTALFTILAGVAVLAIPLSVGLAILRHRLYDIDLVINRTIVYGALTASLGLVYAGLVAGLPVMLPLAGDNDILVAAATLAVAALVAPLRRRIQGLVDRRFYRRRYDATRTLSALSARLRDEVGLEVLISDLQVVVRETLQPAATSVWLRPTD